MIEHPPCRLYVLEGRIATMGPAGVLEDGAVFIDSGTIEAVQPAAEPPASSKYAGAPRIRTGGTIFPGFIELHNHLSYNAMPLWDVPTRYTNNAQWRGIESYTRRITKPSQVLGQTDRVAQALVRYAECRALLGGTTTSQGITLASAGGLTKYYQGLVRNAEEPDDPRLTAAGTRIANPDSGAAAAYLATLNNHTCYLQHLSEGTDATARAWFQRLQISDQDWAVTPVLCGIHCAALLPEDFAVLAQRSASMVWSPLSNYLLYGETADIRAAADAGISISLGSDWAPSGSKNLLGELKVAWLASQQHGDVFTPRQLVEMVTINPARALKWDAHLGTIEVGKLADLVVIDGRSGDPFELLLEARETSITLVVIHGVPRTGQPRLMRRFWDASLTGASWIDSIHVGRTARQLYLEHENDMLQGLHLSDAITALEDGMARLPELAQQLDAAVGVGNAMTTAGSVTVGGGMEVAGATFRVVPDFEEADTQAQIDAMGFALAAQPYAFWVTEPMVLDAITVADDPQHLRRLVQARNLPEFVKRGLPKLYGETIALPDSALFLERERAKPVAPQLLATTRSLHILLAAFGELSLDDRKRIVEQAIVLLTENYVHLPLKRAMHAIDPVQRLRLLRQRLDEIGPEAMDPEIEFHTEVSDIFNSLRDLHTGYRLPEPFGTKVAWLPFLVEEVWDRGERSFILTKWVLDAWPDRRMKGARLTHWNGMSIETAVARNAERNAGSNRDARHARGLNSLTIRPLGRGLPPDEDWVTLRWLDTGGQAHEERLEWLVFEPGAGVGPGDLFVESTAIGLDDHSDDIQQVRKILFAPEVAIAEHRAAGQMVAEAMQAGAASLESFMPGVFRANVVRPSEGREGDPSYGYIRIFTFNVPASGPFVDEFVRLAGLLPEAGLVIDIRGNGGGLIYAAEELLQVLTPRRIEPEPAQFINTPLNLRICRNHAASTALPGLVLEPWIASIELSTRTGAQFSRAVTITSPEAANARGQTYGGPVVLITDALCYSAADMFAAGFQDHEIGSLIGVGGATGAGGANVWSHDLLRKLMEPDNTKPGASPYEPLPRGAGLRVAVRRTTRVGKQAGNLLEDLGVVPDLTYRMTQRDVMESNRDLIDRAIGILAERKAYAVAIDRVARHRDRAPSVTIRTRNLSRIDAEVDGRRLSTRNVADDRVTLELDEVLDGPVDLAMLRILGYEGDALVLQKTLEVRP